jgi:hypothetical protein
MRYLVSITPDRPVIDQVDTSGEVMPLLTWLRETFKPEAFYLEAAQRKIWMVVELATAGELNKLTCVGIFKFGAPGPTATDLFLDGKDQETIDRLLKQPPLERLGTPPDIASAVSFLTGPDGNWTATSFPVIL